MVPRHRAAERSVGPFLPGRTERRMKKSLFILKNDRIPPSVLLDTCQNAHLVISELKCGKKTDVFGELLWKGIKAQRGDGRRADGFQEKESCI